MKRIYLISEDGRAWTDNDKLADVMEKCGWHRCTAKEYRNEGGSIKNVRGPRTML